MSGTNNSYVLTFDRNQLEEDLDIIISDLRWQELTDRIDETIAEVMAELSAGNE